MPVQVELRGETIELFFTLEVMELIQETFDMSITDLPKILDPETYREAVPLLLKILALKAPEPTIYSDEELILIFKAIVAAVNEGMHCTERKSGKPSKQKVKKDEKFNVARCIYFGTAILHQAEEEVWKMTPGKIITLMNEHADANSIDDEEEAESLDDIF